jgi:archaellum component FlaC
MDDDINQRLDAIERNIATLSTNIETLSTGVASLSDRLGRQVAVTEALRGDIRLLTGITRSMFTAIQALVGSAADLSSRITDLENPAG